ncbi:MAG: LapA family protein [Patescibacteria group bacterium]
MLVLFIFGLLLGGVAVIFALQNVSIVTVAFFQWQFEGSLAMVLLLAIGCGVLVSLLMILPGSIQTSLKLRNLRKANEKLAEELKKQRELTLFAKHDAPSKAEIEKIENGAIADNDNIRV